VTHSKLSADAILLAQFLEFALPGGTDLVELIENARNEGLTKTIVKTILRKSKKSTILVGDKFLELASGTHREETVRDAFVEEISDVFERCTNPRETEALLWSGCCKDKDIGSVVAARTFQHERSFERRSESSKKITNASASTINRLHRSSMIELLLKNEIHKPFANSMVHALVEEAMHLHSEYFRDVFSSPTPSPRFLLVGVLFLTSFPLYTLLVVFQQFSGTARRIFDNLHVRGQREAQRQRLTLFEFAQMGAPVIRIVFEHMVNMFSVTFYTSAALGFGQFSGRGDASDFWCTVMISSTLIHEVDELWYKGLKDYCHSPENLSDVAYNICLMMAFAVRLGWIHIDTSEHFVGDDDAYDAYVPESAFLAVGLGLGWLRVLLSLLKEYESTAVLLQIIQNSIDKDIIRFLYVQLAIWFAFGAAARSLYMIQDGDEEIPGPTIVDFILKQFIWPVAGVDDVGFTGVSAGERPLAGAVLMFTFGILVVLVMMNLLIAMMGDTYEEANENATLNVRAYEAQRIIDMQRKPRMPPPVYVIEKAPLSLGWILHKCGLIKGEGVTWHLPFGPSGWPSEEQFFKWERPEWKPDVHAFETGKLGYKIAGSKLTICTMCCQATPRLSKLLRGTRKC
jgi:hypothetical protein